MAVSPWPRYAVGIQRIYQDADDSGRPVARNRALVMSALLIAIFLLVIVGLYETIKFQLLASYTFTLTVSTLIGATGASEIAMPRLSTFQARRELRRTAKLKEPNIERDAC